MGCCRQYALRSDDADAFQLLKQFSAELRSDRELVMVKCGHFAGWLTRCMMRVEDTLTGACVSDRGGERRLLPTARQ